MTDLVRMVLVPVEPFGGECEQPCCVDHTDVTIIGMCDAVGPAWSDCNRAFGKFYRVEDLGDGSDVSMTFEGEPVRVEIFVRPEDVSFFDRRFGDPTESARDRQIEALRAEIARLTAQLAAS